MDGVMNRFAVRGARLAVKAIFGIALSASLLSAGEKTLTLTSESSVIAKPDVAVIQFDFTAFGWTVDKAQTKVDRTVKKFLDKLAQNQVTPSQVVMGNFRLKPSYQFNRDLKAHVPSDFLVSREVTIELEDLSAIGRLMDTSLSVGSFLLESAKLPRKDKPGPSRMAFEKALEEGKRKGEGMARPLGAKLGNIISIEELGSEIEEANLIQGSDLAGMAAGTLALEPRAEQELKDQENAIADEGLSVNSEVLRARSRLKIVFSLQ